MNEPAWQQVLAKLRRAKLLAEKDPTQPDTLDADLAALSGFFDLPWRRPVAGITQADKACLLNNAGYYLQALGRLVEAAEPLQAGLESRISLQDWKNAAISAGNLSGLYLTIGDLRQSLSYARRAVELADRSGDSFERMGSRSRLANALHQAGRLSEEIGRAHV